MGTRSQYHSDGGFIYEATPSKSTGRRHKHRRIGIRGGLKLAARPLARLMGANWARTEILACECYFGWLELSLTHQGHRPLALLHSSFRHSRRPPCNCSNPCANCLPRRDRLRLRAPATRDPHPAAARSSLSSTVPGSRQRSASGAHITDLHSSHPLLLAAAPQPMPPRA